MTYTLQMKTKHSQLLCLLCGDRFRSRSRFHRHILHHKIEKRKNPVHCQFCKYTFSSKLKCEYHINDDHRYCYCDFTSANIKKVRNHKQTCHLRLFDVQSGRGKRSPLIPSDLYKLSRGIFKLINNGSQDAMKQLYLFKTTFVSLKERCKISSTIVSPK